jgi:hypothetical protein
MAQSTVSIWYEDSKDSGVKGQWHAEETETMKQQTSSRSLSPSLSPLFGNKAGTNGGRYRPSIGAAQVGGGWEGVDWEREGGMDPAGRERALSLRFRPRWQPRGGRRWAEARRRASVGVRGREGWGGSDVARFDWSTQIIR